MRKDLATQKVDTVLFVSEPEIIWQSENVDVSDSAEVAVAMKPRRATRKKMLEDDGRWQWGNLNKDFFINFNYYVYRFEYPSVNAEGNTVFLSAIAACPTPKACSKVNNIIIGTHITITSDRERPSAQTNNFSQQDWGMMMSLAAGPKLALTEDINSILYSVGTLGFIAGFGLTLTGIGAIFGVPMVIVSVVADTYLVDQVAKVTGFHDYNNNLVIMADYEGYGISKDHAHPYLYQELTARQCIDATRHGRYLYEHDEKLKYLRHDIRSDFRCMSMGYSQGGSVAMACHRFIEQNNLTNELHFVGSACGDGPYDPMATLMFYVQQNLEGKPMKMSLVLPLIVKGMLDTNPYMESHKAEDYFRPEFLATGVMDWIASKLYSTTGIEHQFKDYAEANPGTLNYNNAKLRDIMNDECYTYFKNLYNANKDTFTNKDGIPLPAHRGVIEDLHFALSSNDLTSGWSPQHPLKLFHSKGDNVVPYVNAVRAKNALGDIVELEDAPNGQDHIDSGTDFFRGDSEIMDVVVHRMFSLRMIEYVNKLCNKKW